MSSLQQLTAKEYAEKTVADAFKQSAYSSWEWTGKGLTVTLLSMYYSESGTATLRIQMVSTGKTVSAFYIGNSNDVERAMRLWGSFWDTTLPKS